MEIVRAGVTRHVILAGRFAFKFPAIWRWQTFLWGLLANMQERLFSKTEWPELAPVVFSDPLGLLLVMRRARVMTDEEFEKFDYYVFTHRGDGSVVPVEAKSDSFGWIADQVVAIDYGS